MNAQNIHLSSTPSARLHLVTPSYSASTRSVPALLEGIDLKPQNVHEALECLYEVSARFRTQGDPRAVFPDVYAVITRRVKEAIEDTSSPLFLEPAWISRLAGRFCERYFDALVPALEGEPIRSSAWSLADHYADLRLGLPVQDALLGINAHINYDLAQGLYDNVLGSNAAGDPEMLARYRHDHDAVNGILEAAMPEILEILVHRYHCPATRLITANQRVCDAICQVTMRIVSRWRDQVWDALVALLEAENRAAFRAVITRMDLSSALTAQLICSANVALRGTRRLLADLRRRSRATQPATSGWRMAA